MRGAGIGGLTARSRALAYATADAPSRKAIAGMAKLSIAEGMTKLSAGLGFADVFAFKVRKTLYPEPAKDKDEDKKGEAIKALTAAAADDSAVLDEKIRKGLLSHAESMVAEVKAEFKNSKIPGRALLPMMGIDSETVERSLSNKDPKIRQAIQVRLNELEKLFSSFVDGFSLTPDPQKDESTKLTLKQMAEVTKELIAQ